MKSLAPIPVLVLLLLGWPRLTAAREPTTPPPPPESQQLLQDPSFEASPPGSLPGTALPAPWEVQRTGREEIRDRLRAICVSQEGLAKSGRNCLELSIPQNTSGFEFVTVGQRLRLAAHHIYEASAWVRWPAGPATPPHGANSASGSPSAIVSFWARHRNGKGAFAGRDVWLFDNRWHRLTFRFCATDPSQPTLLYVSLLPNQKPRDTTVLLDDFELAAWPAADETGFRSGTLTADPGFEAQPATGIGPPWRFAHLGGSSIGATVAGSEGQKWITLHLPPGTSNFESAQLSQQVELRSGVRYEVSCRLRWDNFNPEAPPPIVNYGIFHEDSLTWYGPVDQVLARDGEWHSYEFAHLPPWTGRWKLYVQLNGWGNFRREVTVSCDDFTCAPAP